MPIIPWHEKNNNLQTACCLVQPSSFYPRWWFMEMLSAMQLWEFFDCVLRDPEGKKTPNNFSFISFVVLSQSCDCSYSSLLHPHAQTGSFMVFIFVCVYLPSVGFVRASGSCSRPVTVLWWMCRVSVSGEDPIIASELEKASFLQSFTTLGNLKLYNQLPVVQGNVSLHPPMVKCNLRPHCAAWLWKWAEFVFLS